MRPSKRCHARQIPLTATDYFATKYEVGASELANMEELPEEKHIFGQVFMLWPVSKNNCKLQLKIGPESLDVVFQGPGVDKLGFMSKDTVRIALKGGRKETKKAGNSNTLPFKLVFSKGAVVQFLTSPKRDKDKLVDLFRDAEEEKRRAENDWFYSPAPENSVHGKVDFPIELVYTPSRLNDPTAIPQHGALVSPTDAVLGREQDFVGDDQYKTTKEGPTRNIENDGRQPLLQHTIDSGATEICKLANPSSVKDPLAPDNAPTTVPPPSAIIHLPNKGKRLKKRDTRHNRNSTSGVAPDSMWADSEAGVGQQKPLGKKARQRQAARLAAAEAAKADGQILSAALPPRDPALDLVPGFQSDKGGQYVPIGHVASGSTYSLVGVVADVGVTKTTRTGERSKSFVLVDPSQCDGEGLTINIFVSQSDEEHLPSAKQGQVLLLRHVKVKEFYGKMQGTCYKDSFQWCGYDPAQGRHFYTVTRCSSPPSENSPVSELHDVFFRVTNAELEYFVKISDWWRALKEAQEKRNNANSDSRDVHTFIVPRQVGGRRNLVTISKMEAGKFVDCVVELLKIKKNHDHTEIFVTDYSENKHLYYHPEATFCPIGRKTLVVTLWDGAHELADDLEVHDLYLLENMRLKISKEYIEGSIGYTDRGPRKIGLHSTQVNLPELLLRKKKHDENPDYPPADPDDERVHIPEPMQQGHTIMIDETPADIQSDGTVECLHMDQKCSSIQEVHQCPMCPNRFRIQARIIEYYPRHIGSFVNVECNECGKILNGGYLLCPDCGDLTEGSTTVRYQFALRVVDQSGAELNFSVSDEEADTFMAGISAREARDDVKGLAARLSPLLDHLDKWHEAFDEDMELQQGFGPFLDLCVYSWVPEGGETERLYKLFGCRLCAEVD